MLCDGLVFHFFLSEDVTVRLHLVTIFERYVSLNIGISIPNLLFSMFFCNITRL